tara:strand:+ start:736 stop:1596 length:861 start_codon:yes stop_codon:yes gene_type:complete
MANEFIARKGLTALENSQISGSLNISDTLTIPGFSDVSASLAAAGGGSGISAVVDDTSPQLGGNLDLNSKNITGTGNVLMTGSITASANVAIGGDFILDNNQSLSAKNTSGAIRILARVDSSDVAVFNAGLTQTSIGGASGIELTGPVTANSLIHSTGSGISSAGDIGKGAEITTHGGTGTGTAEGRSYYFNGTEWAVATQASEAANKGLLGIAMGSTSADGMCLKGFVKTDVTSLTPGSPAYMNTNATITTTVPSTSGNYVRIIGYAINSSSIFFNPSNEFIELA